MICYSEERISAFSGRDLSGTNTSGVVTFTNVLLNEGGDYDASTGVFTCRIPGLYFFSATLTKLRSSSSPVDLIYCWIYVNLINTVRIYTDPTDDDTDNGSYSASASVALRLQRSDRVYLGGCSPASYFSSPRSSFSGFLIQPDDL